MMLEHAGVSQIGSRAHNEDCYAYKQFQDHYLFVVADGLGEHPGSDLASRFFCEGMLVNLKSSYLKLKKDPKSGMEHLIQLAQQFMSKGLKKAKKPEGCTTCVIAWLGDKESLFAHVGDSRIYRLSSNHPIWHTIDHSVVQTLVDAGEITEEEAKNHPLENIIFNTVGAESEVNPTFSIQPPLKKGEGVILATDGFWRNVLETDLFDILKSQNLQGTLTQCVENTVQSHEVIDNITAIFLRRP